MSKNQKFKMKNTHTMIMIPRYCLVASTMEIEEVNLELLKNEKILDFFYRKDAGFNFNIDDEGNLILPEDAFDEEAIKRICK